MKMWETVAGVAVCLLAALSLAISLIRLHRSKSSLQWIGTSTRHAKKLHTNELTADVRLVIVLPCLNEQSLVRDTLSYFLSLMANVGCECLIVPITGESERIAQARDRERVKNLAQALWYKPGYDTFVRRSDSALPLSAFSSVNELLANAPSFQDFQSCLLRLFDAIPTTNDLIADFVPTVSASSNIRIVHLHEPSCNSTKASKVNFAIRTLLSNNANNRFPTYIGIYDFDSRPPIEVFKYLLWDIQEHQTNGIPINPIYQQTPVQLSDKLLDLRPSQPAFLAAVWHVERALGLETFDIPPNHVVDRSRPFQRVRSCMGAGLFIEATTWHSFGGLPDDSDDIAFGYRIEWLGIERAALPISNFVDPTPTDLALIRQYDRIYLGKFTALREANWVCQTRPANLPKHVLRRSLACHLADAAPAIALWSFAGAVALAAPLSWILAGSLASAGWIFYATLLYYYYSAASELRYLGALSPLPRLPLRSYLIGAFFWGAFISLMHVRYLFRRLIMRSPQAEFIESTGR